MFPVAGALAEFCGDGGLAKLVGHARDGPVVEGVFQRLGGRFAFFVDGHVAQLAVLRDAVVRAVVGAGDHGIERFVGIEAADAFHEGVGNHRHGVVADHAPGFQAVERPDGQDAVGALAARGEQGIDHVAAALRRLHQGQQRMQGAVGVPEREGGIVGPATRLMHRIVRPAVLAIAVHEQGGAEQGVIQRGVELGALLRRALRIDRRQRLCPLRARIGAHAVEIEIGHLRVEIGDGAGLADRRQRNLDHQRRAIVGDVEHADQLPAFDLCALRGFFSPGGGKPLYGTSCSVSCNWVAVSGREKRMAKYSWRPGAQPRVSRKPVTVPSSRTRSRDHCTLPG